MKNILISVFCIGMLLCASQAKAEDSSYTYGGTQFVFNASLDRDLGKGIGVRGTLCAFWVPEDEMIVGLVYLGASFVPVSSDAFTLWIAPHAAVYGNWWEESDAVGPSLWVDMKFASGKLSVFIEGDTVFGTRPDQLELAGQDTWLYYGYYAVSGNPTDWFSFGGQVEQVNTGFQAGPHVALSQGPMKFKAEFYTNAEVANVRLTGSLSF